jgi:hypothetical protein
MSIDSSPPRGLSRARVLVAVALSTAIGVALLPGCGGEGGSSVTLPSDVTLPSRPTTTAGTPSTDAPATTAVPPTTEAAVTTSPPATTSPPPTTAPPPTAAPTVTSPDTSAAPTTAPAPPASEEAAPEPVADEDTSSGTSWWWILGLGLVVAAIVVVVQMRRRSREESERAAEMEAVRDKAIALAELARLTTTTTDVQSGSFRWAQFDRDRDELVRRLAPLAALPEYVSATELGQSVADLATAVAYDRDLRLGGSATADQLAFARASVLERTSALEALAAPSPAA